MTFVDMFLMMALGISVALNVWSLKSVADSADQTLEMLRQVKLLIRTGNVDRLLELCDRVLNPTHEVTKP